MKKKPLPAVAIKNLNFKLNKKLQVLHQQIVIGSVMQKNPNSSKKLQNKKDPEEQPADLSVECRVLLIKTFYGLLSKHCLAHDCCNQAATK